MIIKRNVYFSLILFYLIFNIFVYLKKINAWINKFYFLVYAILIKNI